MNENWRWTYFLTVLGQLQEEGRTLRGHILASRWLRGAQSSSTLPAANPLLLTPLMVGCLLNFIYPGPLYAQGRTPFSAKTIERRFSVTGSEDATETITEAFKSDGSQAKIVKKLAATKQWAEAKTLIDVPERKRTELEPLTESRTTTPLSARYADYLRVKPKSCGEGGALEKELIHGQAVFKVMNEYTLPNGEVDRVERWMAPGLDCFPLREKFSKGPKAGPFHLKLTREVTSLKVGEPDPSFFSVPAHFKERSASAVAAEFKRKYPKLAEEGCAPCTTTPVPGDGK